MPIAQVNGCAVHYLQMVDGEAPPGEDLVMVHGLATNMAFWYLPYAPAFAKRFRVTLFDLRGLGRSGTTETGYTPENLSRDLEGLLDHLGIARAHLVAHSFGGVVALNLAKRSRDRVASLVLCDTHLGAVRHHTTQREWGNRERLQRIVDQHGLGLDTFDPYFGYRLLTKVAHLQVAKGEVPQELLELVGPMMGRQGQRTAAQWVRLMDTTNAEAELMGDDGLDLATLKALHVPTLALYGDHSQARLTGGELLQVWPHAEFRRIRDAGHFFPVSRAEDVVFECTRFWSGEFPARPPVRAGEDGRRHFRSDRVFQTNGEWWFTTREQSRVGPFAGIEEARATLAQYLAAVTLAPA